MPLGAPASAKPTHEFKTLPVSFEDLPKWREDDHLSALRAFAKSARPILAAKHSSHAIKPPAALLELLAATTHLDIDALGTSSAKAFFEDHFTPHRIVHTGPTGLLTGYYEPVLAGSRTGSEHFAVPVYRRPPDLENLVAESERGAMAHAMTHARRTALGLEPYATREEIERGGLAGQGLELVWLNDPVDCFFMHVQGSGRIRFEDGSMTRITYDGKNGHPYTSIGRYLIDNDHLTAEAMTLDALKSWLTSDAERGRPVMWQNKSFVFFRELRGSEAESPLGALEIPLWEGRSLAIDTAYHALGTPVFVSAPELTHAGGSNGLNRLMIASDVGSAIRGPERGDIYFGSGPDAGSLAGVTKHPGRFFVLLPRAPNAP